MNTPSKIFCLLSTVYCLLSLPSPASESWAARASQMNRREITADSAKTREAGREEDRRNKISMPRIRPAMAGFDWDADPTAIPYVHYQINKRTELPVYVFNDGLDLASPDLFRYTIVYLTSHGRWSLTEKETENLSLWLKRGGTLILDDCYNRGSAFAESVRPEVGKLIPGAEPILLLKEDPRVADVFKMVYPSPWPGEAAFFENRPWQYVLLDGRPAVLFSPNDDGCGWEISTPPTASNPLGEGIGHGGDNTVREMIYQWAVNWMLFTFTH
ncbi:MAG: DUF4159 domain-containing protein [bacterium]|jgi:hypothetical protein